MKNSVWLLKIGLLVSIFTSEVFQISSEITTALAKRRINFENRTNSFRQLWKVTTNVAYFCIAQCDKDVRCASVFFNWKLNQCHGHAITLSKPETFEVGSRYYVMAFGEHYIGDVCTSNADCWPQNAECRHWMCECIPGYSFSPSTHECKVCNQYGDQFTEVQNHWIQGFNRDAFERQTLGKCAWLCLNRIGYRCITFEFNHRSGLCTLQEKTKLEVLPINWVFQADTLYHVSYYQRDCA